MIKKVRTPGQMKVRTTAQSVKVSGASGMNRKRPATPKTKESPKVEDEVINLDDIILE